MYNKLFTKILDSSIWLEPTPTRIVWLTFIAVMDESGFAQFASIGNVAHRARVTLEEAQAAVACFEGPDPDSSNPDHNGQRLERVPGGWMVLNAKQHREMVTRALIQGQTRERVRRHREKKRTSNADVTTSEAIAVARSEERSETKAEGVRARGGASPLAGTFPRDHLRHSWCSGRGKCVPDFLHAEFCASVGGDGAEQRLKAFYEAVELGWPDGPIGDDPVKLWRREFAAKFPSVAPVGKGAMSSAIGKRQLVPDDEPL